MRGIKQKDVLIIRQALHCLGEDGTGQRTGEECTDVKDDGVMVVGGSRLKGSVECDDSTKVNESGALS